MRPYSCSLIRAGLGLSLVASAALVSDAALAANHREAPITALDHKADITDFFAFVSYDDPSKVTLILAVDPLLEPGNGPNYFPFDDEILYSIKIDNDHDAVEDIVFEFRFATEIRAPGVFTGFVGALTGVPAPANAPPDLDGNTTVGAPVVPPAITALNGPGSEGLSLRQNYSVTLVKDGQSTLLNSSTLYAVPSNVGPRTMPDYQALADQGIYDLGGGVQVFAGTVEDPFWIDLGAAFDSLNFRPDAFDTGVPGVLSDAQDAIDIVNYAPDEVAGFNVNAIAIEVPIALITQDGEIHPAEQPEATIGAWGTTSRPRASASASVARVNVAFPALLNASYNGPVAASGISEGFIVDRPAAFAVTAERVDGVTAALPDPALSLRRLDGTMLAANDDCDVPDIEAVIGRQLTTEQDACIVRELSPGSYVAEVRDAAGASGNVLFSITARSGGQGSFAQIQRMANPLFNELIIGTGDKDKFSMSQPKDDAQFADYALDPLLARVLNAVYEALFGPDILPIPAPPREDLLLLVQYLPPIAAEGTPPGPVADLLRLNTGIAPTPAAARSRLGVLGGDLAGFPNGRRVSDDVTDIAARVVAGVLAGPPFDGFPHANIGDGVNANDTPYRETFPYVWYAHSGRDSRHVDTGELGCVGICP